MPAQTSARVLAIVDVEGMPIASILLPSVKKLACVSVNFITDIGGSVLVIFTDAAGNEEI